METRPEWALYLQDDFRVNSKLTLNMGLRWDVFVPWVEENDRQSNYDPSTGFFVVASDDAVINGTKVGRYLQTYSKGDFGPRFGFAYDLNGDGKTVRPRRLRHLLELGRGRNVLVEGHEPAVPPDHRHLGVGRSEQPACCPHGLPTPRRSNPALRPGRLDAVRLRDRLPRQLRHELERQLAAADRPQLHGRAGLRGLARPPAHPEDQPEPGPADPGRERTATSTGRRSPSARPPCATWAPCRAPAPSTTTPCSSRA